MRISDWSSDVCSSDLGGLGGKLLAVALPAAALQLHGAALEAARTDHELPGQADQIHVGELGAGRLVAVVVEHLDAGGLELAVEPVAGRRAVGVGGAQVDRKSTRLHSSH